MHDGQLADQGVIELANGARVEVRDVQSPVTGLVVHQARVLSGEVVVGEAAHAVVDTERRPSISRAHTATHMVHKAFREALGDTATVVAGCRKSFGTCKTKFANLVNFRGYPHIPGSDVVTRYGVQGALEATGGSLFAGN